MDGGRDAARSPSPGRLLGSPEAFAAASEPREDGLAVVRHATGPVSNRLNRAFYDRRGDWVLSVDEPARAELAPVAPGDSTVASSSPRPGARCGFASVRGSTSGTVA